MRYLLVTYLRKPGGQIDEQVGFSKRLRNSDIQTCNVIMDYAEQRILKCVIEGKVLDKDFASLHMYYEKAYPSNVGQLAKLNFPEELQETVTVPETTEAADDTK